jgi:hypothetical protein
MRWRETEQWPRAVFGATETQPQTTLSRLCLLPRGCEENPRLPRPDARQKEILKALQVPLRGQSLLPNARGVLTAARSFERGWLAVNLCSGKTR